MSGSVLAGTRFSPRARGRSTRPLVARWARRSRAGPAPPPGGAPPPSPLRAEPDMADMAGSGLEAHGTYDASQMSAAAIRAVRTHVGAPDARQQVGRKLDLGRLPFAQREADGRPTNASFT
jgi:hypothetical protein